MKIWNLKTPLSLFASLIWNLSEYFNISLKNLAPIVFHLMIGSKKHKKLNP